MAAILHKEKKMITKQTSLIPNFLGKPDFYYVDKETGRKYRRIYAGMQWPGAKAGAIIVLGETLEVNADLDERPIWVLAEYANKNPSEIFAKCREFRELMCVQEFFGDIYNRLMMVLKSESKSGFNLSKAPSVDNANAYETYLAIIREKTSATNKVLNFGKSRVLREELAAMTSVPAGNSFRTDFPHIAALGYALAALVVNTETKPVLCASYGPLDEGVGI
jgi:hypothetical protein